MYFVSVAHCALHACESLALSLVSHVLDVRHHTNVPANASRAIPVDSVRDCGTMRVQVVSCGSVWLIQIKTFAYEVLERSATAFCRFIDILYVQGIGIRLGQGDSLPQSLQHFSRRLFLKR